MRINRPQVARARGEAEALGAEGKPVFCKSKKLKKTFWEEFEDIGSFADDRIP